MTPEQMEEVIRCTLYLIKPQGSMRGSWIEAMPCGGDDACDLLSPETAKALLEFLDKTN